MKISTILTTFAAVQGAFINSIDRRGVQSTNYFNQTNDFDNIMIKAQKDEVALKQEEPKKDMKVDDIPKEVSKKIKELFESEQAKALALPPVDIPGQVETYRNYVKKAFSGAFTRAREVYKRTLKGEATETKPSYQAILKDFLTKAQKYAVFSAKNDAENFDKSLGKYIGSYYTKVVNTIESRSGKVSEETEV